MTPLPLRVFAYLRSNDSALAGDLMEEYARGRSTSWLWHQVAVALATGAWSDVKRHPVDGVRAATVLALILPAALWLFSIFPQPLEWRTSGPVVFLRFDWLVAIWMRGFVSAMFCGWVAGRFAGRFRNAVLVSLAVATTSMIVQSAWVVAAVLSQYPWNGLFVFASGASLYASLVSALLFGLWVGGRLSMRFRHLVRASGASA